MSERNTMNLYSRNDCPLCEDVEETLMRLDIPFKFIDIDLDSKLLKKYHTRVPVLMNGQEELSWPFDDAAILRLAGQ